MIIVIALGGFFALKLYALNNEVRIAQEQMIQLELQLEEQKLINQKVKKNLAEINYRYQLSLRTVDDRRMR